MHNFSFYRSKVQTYDEVVEKLAERIGLDDPSKIRLTAHNCYSQQPKPQPIKYRGVDHLSDMLVHYNQVFFFFLDFNSVFLFAHLHDLGLKSGLHVYRCLIYCIMKSWTFPFQNCKV